MFRSQKGQNKRKATRWRAAPCLHGNHSIDSSKLELTLDVTSSTKRRRLTPTDDSIFSSIAIRNDEVNNLDLSPRSQTDNGSDKENTPLFGLHGNKDSKTNLFMESFIPFEGSTSYHLPKLDMSTPNRPLTGITDDFSVTNLTTSPLLITPVTDSPGTNKVQESTLMHLGQCKSLSMVTAEESTDLKDNNLMRLAENNLKSQTKHHGQLKLRIEVSLSRQLIIFVEEATNLSSGNTDLLLSYIETMLTPDKRTVQKSHTTMTSNNPRYDEKITYDLSTEDESKRLMVSIRSKQNNTDCSNMVGCMSFGIKNLLSKCKKKNDVPVNGWYHLLSENLGGHKHLVCNHGDVLAKQQGQDNYASAHETTKDTTKLQKKLNSTKKLMVTVTKGSSGYGFTIKGTAPVRIGHAKPGSAAELAGLRRGDYILSINNQDTTSSTVEMVANIVRKSPHRLQIQVARPLRPKVTKSSGHLVKSMGSSITPQFRATESPWQPEISAMREKKSVSGSRKLLSDIRNRRRMDTPTRSIWQPDLSNIIPVEGQNMLHGMDNDEGMMYDGEGIYEEIRDQDLQLILHTSRYSPNTCQVYPDSETTEEYTAIHPNTPCSQTSKSYTRELETAMCDTNMTQLSWCSEADESRFYQSCTSESDSFGDNKEQTIHDTTSIKSQIDDESCLHSSCSNDGLDGTASIRPQLTAEEQLASTAGRQLACAAGRQVAIHQLLTCEEDFTRMMKRGAQRFSRPLRHQLLSPSQHALLFQNIEKLLALSEFHICQMINKSYCAEDSYMSITDGIIADMAGQIYENKISMLCEAYQMYYQGLDEALHLLQNLRQRTTFNKFLKRAERSPGYDLSLSEFLEQPLSHFHQVVGCLGRVLLTTLPGHADYVHIKHVMTVVHQSVAAHTPGNHGDLGSGDHDDSASFRSSSTCSYSQKLRKSCRSHLSPSSSSMDSEMLELQQKLSFSDHVKPFQLATANRHVILSGDLMYISDSSVKSCQVVLCSDLLLLTQKEAKGQLKVIEEPILLQQVIQADFDCVHAEEFCILSQEMTSRESRSTHEYKFRATNMEQKWAWKTILGQRIKNVRSKTDSAYVSMEEFV